MNPFQNKSKDGVLLTYDSVTILQSALHSTAVVDLQSLLSTVLNSEDVAPTKHRTTGHLNFTTSVLADMYYPRDANYRIFVYNDQRPEGVPDDLSKSHEVYKLKDMFALDGRSFCRLIDFSGVRYVLLIDFNDEDNDCLENELLRNMHQALQKNERPLIGGSGEKCMQPFWVPLVKDYLTRLRDGSVMKPIGPLDFDRNESHKLQLKTIDGSVLFVEHDVEVDRTVVPADNEFPELRCIQKEKIEILVKVASGVLKAKIEGKVWCVRTLRHGMHRGFLNEIEKLRKVRHPNVQELHGLVESSKGKVIGMVVPFFPGSDLAAVRSASQLQKEKWKAKISDAIAHLHQNGVVWGDAKPANIMINSVNDEPILIDFEGWWTEGWVDEHLHDTQAGDMQGLKRILNFIEDIPSS